MMYVYMYMNVYMYMYVYMYIYIYIYLFYALAKVHLMIAALSGGPAVRDEVSRAVKLIYNTLL